MSAKALEVNLQMSLKIVNHCNTFFFEISQIFSVFNAFSSSMSKLMALNTTKFEKSQKRNQFVLVTILRDVCKFASNGVAPIWSIF